MRFGFEALSYACIAAAYIVSCKSFFGNGLSVASSYRDFARVYPAYYLATVVLHAVVELTRIGKEGIEDLHLKKLLLQLAEHPVISLRRAGIGIFFSSKVS